MQRIVNPEDNEHAYSDHELVPERWYLSELRFDHKKRAVQVVLDGQVIPFGISEAGERPLSWVPLPVEDRYFQLTNLHAGCYAEYLPPPSTNEVSEEDYWIDNKELQIFTLYP